MSSRRRIILVVVGVVGNVVGTFLLSRARVLGFTRTYSGSVEFEIAPNRHADAGEHHRIAGTPECEDLHFHSSSGLLFAACQAEYGSRHEWDPPLTGFGEPPSLTNKQGAGTLVTIDPQTMKATRLELVEFNIPFFTHGIDIFPDGDGAVYIHAVNHLASEEYLAAANRTAFAGDRTRSQIEIFHHMVGSGEAKHVRTVRHPLIRTPNDILATGPTSFFVTNDHKYKKGFFRELEDLGGKRTAGWTETLHVIASESARTPEDGVDAVVAISGMHNNNGIGRTAVPGQYVINSAAGGVSTIVQQDGRKLKEVGRIAHQTTLDNPSYFEDPYVAETGSNASGIINGGLSQAGALVLAHDPTKASGIVWHVKPTASGWGKPEPIFQDDATLIKMITTAVVVAIDPKRNKGRKQGWLFVTSIIAEAVVAVRVDL